MLLRFGKLCVVRMAWYFSSKHNYYIKNYSILRTIDVRVRVRMNTSHYVLNLTAKIAYNTETKKNENGFAMSRKGKK